MTEDETLSWAQHLAEEVTTIKNSFQQRFDLLNNSIKQE
jgi:hypothetical protein